MQRHNISLRMCKQQCSKATHYLKGSCKYNSVHCCFTRYMHHWCKAKKKYNKIGHPKYICVNQTTGKWWEDNMQINRKLVDLIVDFFSEKMHSCSPPDQYKDTCCSIERHFVEWWYHHSCLIKHFRKDLATISKSIQHLCCQ